MNVKGISILGSTGSIGRNTLDVIARHPERFGVVALAGGSNIKLLSEQARKFRPRYVSTLTEDGLREIRKNLSGSVEVGFGLEGAVRAATYHGADLTVSAISGAAGLVPTLEAIKAGKDIALANKEVLVVAGPIVMEEVRKRGVKLMPVDSEHSAVFQALKGQRKEDVRRIILTASGGPFLGLPLEELKGVSPSQALRHPRWKMGRKITIDSATLMNKGLEVVEARYLFDIPETKIAVFIHPESIVHSMVEYIDGSIISQMGTTDMRGPIAYALAYPERIDSGLPRLDIAGLRLEFLEPEPERFPCLGLAYEALGLGGTAPAVLNASDEVAVESFLEGRIRFTDIFGTIKEVLSAHDTIKNPSLDDLLEADRWARERAGEVIKDFCP